jgi:hypothetical protein
MFERNFILCNNIGAGYSEKGEVDEALTWYFKALRLNPKSDKTCHNIGNALREQGKIAEAIAYYRKAIALNPAYPGTHWNLSQALLLTGNFEEGWQRYSWRWKTEEQHEAKNYAFSKKVWDGSSLKSIFVYAEQGIGDEIFFASCLPDITAQADHCVIACDERLVPLFERTFPSCIAIQHFDPDNVYPATLPPVDYKAAMGSLPKYVRPDLVSFPKQAGYLIPDNEKVEKWRTRYNQLGAGLKIGISWFGGKKNTDRLARSIALSRWEPLLRIPGVSFINLQYAPWQEELMKVEADLGIRIYSWRDADPWSDLDDFAAQIAALDLVISIDNSTVHMAGALGVPVWTLLPYVPDWRWMLNREDSPWYPSMRLFRQPSPGAWDEVIAGIKAELGNRCRYYQENTVIQAV